MWPVIVGGSFDMPLGVLAFDESGAGSVASGRFEPLEQQYDRSAPAVIVSSRRGENRALVTASGD